MILMESDHILTRSYPLPEGVNQSVTKITSHYGEKKFKHDKSIAFFKPSRMVCYMIGFELKKKIGAGGGIEPTTSLSPNSPREVSIMEILCPTGQINLMHLIGNIELLEILRGTCYMN